MPDVSDFVFCYVGQKSSVTVHKTTHWVVLFTAFESHLYSRKKQEASSKEDAFCFLAEREGFEPSCACAQTDFESVRLLGSYRTILPQSRLILVVVFQLLNASAIMSSLLDRWREGQTHWRYYSTKTPKNQGVLRK